MLEFHYAPNTIALATHVALEDVGAQYEAHRISFQQEEQKSDKFKALNPKARVPVMITPHGALTETPAMLAYVAQTNPDGPFQEIADPFLFAKVQELNSYICSTLHVAHAHRMRGERWVDDPKAKEAMLAAAPDRIGACFRYLEDHVFVGPFVMGDRYTLSDPYLFTVAQWMEGDGVDPAEYPKIAAHREMMGSRETVKKALAMEFEGL